jgi:hypothetical protein
LIGQRAINRGIARLILDPDAIFSVNLRDGNVGEAFHDRKLSHL